MTVFGLTPEQLVVLGAAFSLGCWCTALQFRVRRSERIGKKAHARLDRITGSDWVRTGQWKSLRDLEEEEGG